MPYIPHSILKKLYNRASLKNTSAGVSFSIRNRLSPASLERIEKVVLDGQSIPVNNVNLKLTGGEAYPADHVDPANPVDFPLASLLTFKLAVNALEEGPHELELVFVCQPFGKLKLKITDTLGEPAPEPGEIPRDHENDYDEDIIQARQEFIRSQTGVKLDHIK